MENYVKFLRGTPAAFEKLAAKDNNTLYFISEPGAKNGLLYLGDKLIAGGSSGDISNLSLGDLKDIVIDKASLVDGSILSFDWASQKWVSKSLDEVLVDVMTGATSTEAGTSGLVPAPQAGEQNKFLRGDGTWADATLSAETLQDISGLKSTVGSLVGDSAREDGSIPSIAEIATGVLTEALIPAGAKESLDTLQEIAAWIQDHPDDISAINKDITDLKSTVGNLETVVSGVNGLDDRVGTLEDILNDTTTPEGETVPGLVSVVNSLLKNPIDESKFVLNTTYKSEVGDINNLLFSEGSNTTIIDEINSINQRLKWVDMSE